jgi:ketosteroid isomerase-like protein
MRDRVVLPIAVAGGLIAFNAAAEEGTTMTAAHQAVTVFVESGDLLVVRYWLVINQTIDGTPMAQRAPRLTVFRRDGDRWLVVAHANFASAR